MIDETQTHGEDSPTPASPEPTAEERAPHRDVIAERLAARRAENEARDRERAAQRVQEQAEQAPEPARIEKAPDEMFEENFLSAPEVVSAQEAPPTAPQEVNEEPTQQATTGVPPSEQTPRPPERNARGGGRGRDRTSREPKREPGEEREAKPRDERRPAEHRERRTDERRERRPDERQRRPEDRRDRRTDERRERRPAEQQDRLLEGNIAISVVIPLLNEQDSIRELCGELNNVLHRMVGSRFEVILVDDGSTDRSFEIIRDFNSINHCFKGIRFRRNYGKSAALAQGFAMAQGNIVVTMDADLQDDPKEIPNLVNKLREGYDMVSGWKKKRYDPITKTIPSRFFNFVTSILSGVKLHDFNCGLKAYQRDVVKEISVYGELHRFIPVIAHWRGFRVAETVVEHHRRRHGKTKFGSSRFWKGFLDLLTTLYTTRFIKRPLHFFGMLGAFLGIIGLGIDGYVTWEWWMNQTAISNRPIALLGVLLIIVGVQFVSLGLLGEMVVKTRHSEEEYSVKEVVK